jgi:hypothetical protein
LPTRLIYSFRERYTLFMGEGKRRNSYGVTPQTIEGPALEKLYCVEKTSFYTTVCAGHGYGKLLLYNH